MPVTHRLVIAAVVGVLGAAALPTAAVAVPVQVADDPALPYTERVSVGRGGTQFEGASFRAEITDGYAGGVAYTTNAPAAADDTNGVSDAMLGSAIASRTSRDGKPGNGPSREASSCGRFTAFVSEATDLTSNSPTDGRTAVYLRNHTVGKIGRETFGYKGVEFEHVSDPRISQDCQWLTFVGTLPSTPDHVEQSRVYRIKVYDASIEPVSDVAPDGSRAAGRPSISADGRYIAYQYGVPHPGGPANSSDIYVRDMETGTLEKATVAPGGGEADRESTGPVLSADGRKVAFTSYASNLAHGDTNKSANVFVRDLDAHRTRLVKGAGKNVYTGEAALSGDGNFVAYVQGSLKKPDAAHSIHLLDLTTGTTELVNVATDGGASEYSADNPSVNTDGSAVAFDSLSADLVADDTNGAPDVFVRHLR
ncbi:TolB family protein [Actinomycetota bacterium Odt1-20B]